MIPTLQIFNKNQPMQKAILVSSSIAAILLGSVSAAIAAPAVAQAPMPAQPAPMDITDEQLDSFANAYLEIVTIQDESAAAIVAAVEAEGFTIEEFQAIAQTLNSPDGAAAIPSEQAEQFTAAAEEITEIQTEAETEMQAAIQAEDLTVAEFEQIFAMAQQDPALQQQIIQRLETEE